MTTIISTGLLWRQGVVRLERWGAVPRAGPFSALSRRHKSFSLAPVETCATAHSSDSWLVGNSQHGQVGRCSSKRRNYRSFRVISSWCCGGARKVLQKNVNVIHAAFCQNCIFRFRLWSWNIWPQRKVQLKWFVDQCYKFSLCKPLLDTTVNKSDTIYFSGRHWKWLSLHNVLYISVFFTLSLFVPYWYFPP
jgi:hypothetical protein